VATPAISTSSTTNGATSQPIEQPTDQSTDSAPDKRKFKSQSHWSEGVAEEDSVGTGVAQDGTLIEELAKPTGFRRQAMSEPDALDRDTDMFSILGFSGGAPVGEEKAESDGSDRTESGGGRGGGTGERWGLESPSRPENGPSPSPGQGSVQKSDSLINLFAEHHHWLTDHGLADSTGGACVWLAAFYANFML
jgi:hypothetical protein